MCNDVKHDAAPGIDLEQLRPLMQLGMTWGPGSKYRIAAESLADLIDASPKGGSDVEKDAARYRIMMNTENLRSDSEFSRGCYRFFSERDLPINDKRSGDMAIDAALQATSHGAGVTDA